MKRKCRLEILLDFNLKRLGLTKQSKILNISHDHCLDGICCSIVIDNVFRNVSFIRAGYNNIDSILTSVIEKDYDKYDFIFITDISPKEPEILKNRNKIVLLDHHNGAKHLHNPLENKYVIDSPSGSKLVKTFFEQYFGLELKHLTRLILKSSDYDSWTRKYPLSTFLHEILFKIYPDEFKKRFYSGKIRFTKDEFKYLRMRKNKFKEIYENLDIYELNKIEGCFINASEFMNDLCSKLLEEKYKIVFCRNPSKNSVSVRCRKGFINLSDVLSELGIGGGHPEASGMICKDLMDVKNKIDLVEERIYREIKVKKK